ncbi:hypothetical protein [Chitinophaga varians]|uniref:hypothetical protein n=1 Tax=Chitinophaga varians TaxID=2202339 RepID=UPI00165F60C1|nr:hypothetical protein [Chitinophaga varians]MBC9913153.1 hypothetical protein [Chitinophaga varians]
MTEPKSKADKEDGELSEGAKTHLIDVYVSKKYGRQSDVSSKYTEKGTAVEEESITLYCRVKGQFFRKNTEHLTNDFIMGEPDLYEGSSILEATCIIDIKSSWDIFTFFRNIQKKINQEYYWQLMGYMALTGAPEARLGYCLSNTPEHLAADEERKLFYKMNAGFESDPDYIEAVEQLRKLSVYDDVPLSQRVIEFSVTRDEEKIQQIYAKVKKCRQFLNELDKKISNSKYIIVS